MAAEQTAVVEVEFLAAEGKAVAEVLVVLTVVAAEVAVGASAG